MLNRQHIPNLLTFSRVAVIPLCLLLMLLQPQNLTVWLLWLFVLASITDFLDGFLARKWNVISPLGAMLDPIADKLLVGLMLCFLVSVNGHFLAPAALIILREIYMAGLRETLALSNVALPVSAGGKWKTATQMAAITAVLYGMSTAARWAYQLGELLLWLSALLAVLTAYHYSLAAWKVWRHD
jgi:cardiolipin synthase (CMP-forming)